MVLLHSSSTTTSTSTTTTTTKTPERINPSVQRLYNEEKDKEGASMVMKLSPHEQQQYGQRNHIFKTKRTADPRLKAIQKYRPEDNSSMDSTLNNANEPEKLENEVLPRRQDPSEPKVEPTPHIPDKMEQDSNDSNALSIDSLSKPPITQLELEVEGDISKPPTLDDTTAVRTSSKYLEYGSIDFSLNFLNQSGVLQPFASLESASPAHSAFAVRSMPEQNESPKPSPQLIPGSLTTSSQEDGSVLSIEPLKLHSTPVVLSSPPSYFSGKTFKPPSISYLQYPTLPASPNIESISLDSSPKIPNSPPVIPEDSQVLFENFANANQVRTQVDQVQFSPVVAQLVMFQKMFAPLFYRLPGHQTQSPHEISIPFLSPQQVETEITGSSLGPGLTMILIRLLVLARNGPDESTESSESENSTQELHNHLEYFVTHLLEPTDRDSLWPKINSGNRSSIVSFENDCSVEDRLVMTGLILSSALQNSVAVKLHLEELQKSDSTTFHSRTGYLQKFGYMALNQGLLHECVQPLGRDPNGRTYWFIQNQRPSQSTLDNTTDSGHGFRIFFQWNIYEQTVYWHPVASSVSEIRELILKLETQFDSDMPCIAELKQALIKIIDTEERPISTTPCEQPEEETLPGDKPHEMMVSLMDIDLEGESISEEYEGYTDVSSMTYDRVEAMIEKIKHGHDVERSQEIYHNNSLEAEPLQQKQQQTEPVPTQINPLLSASNGSTLFIEISSSSDDYEDQHADNEEEDEEYNETQSSIDSESDSELEQSNDSDSSIGKENAFMPGQDGPHNDDTLVVIITSSSDDDNDDVDDDNGEASNQNSDEFKISRVTKPSQVVASNKAQKPKKKGGTGSVADRKSTKQPSTTETISNAKIKKGRKRKARSTKPSPSKKLKLTSKNASTASAGASKPKSNLKVSERAISKVPFSRGRGRPRNYKPSTQMQASESLAAETIVSAPSNGNTQNRNQVQNSATPKTPLRRPRSVLKFKQGQFNEPLPTIPHGPATPIALPPSSGRRKRHSRQTQHLNTGKLFVSTSEDENEMGLFVSTGEDEPNSPPLSSSSVPKSQLVKLSLSKDAELPKIISNSDDGRSNGTQALRKLRGKSKLQRPHRYRSSSDENMAQPLKNNHSNDNAQVLSASKVTNMEQVRNTNTPNPNTNDNENNNDNAKAQDDTLELLPPLLPSPQSQPQLQSQVVDGPPNSTPEPVKLRRRRQQQPQRQQPQRLQKRLRTGLDVPDHETQSQSITMDPYSSSQVIEISSSD